VLGLGSKWAGHAYGTNIGNIYVELDPKADAPQGTLRFMDRDLGLAVYIVEGTFEKGKLQLQGTPAPDQDVELGRLSVSGQLNSKGELSGNWESALGTAGTFVLFPHDRPQEDDRTDPSAIEEQLHTATRKIGAVRLYAADVLSLISDLRSDFSQGTRVIATYRTSGTEVSRYADDFSKDFSQLGTLEYLKLNLSEPERQGINRTAMIELNGVGENVITTQSTQAAWALGKSERLAANLKKHSKPLSTGFRRYGLNLNSLILLFALTAIPELIWANRVIFLVFIFSIIALIGHIHQRFITNAVIRLSEERPNWIERIAPQTASWILTIASGFLAALTYGLLKGEITVKSITQLFK
jgi:hypothetical protein